MLSIDETIEKEKENAEKLRKIIETGYDGEISIEALFCDDTAAIKEAYERFENCAKEHEQRAEWFEELKALKNGLNIKCDSLNEALEKGKKIGYNKAIDDFVKAIVDRGLSSNDDKYFIILYDNYLKVIKEIAEQLKEGGNIELSEHSKRQGNRTGK